MLVYARSSTHTDPNAEGGVASCSFRPCSLLFFLLSLWKSVPRSLTALFKALPACCTRYGASPKHYYGKLVPENVGNEMATAEGEGALSAGVSDKKNK